MNGRSAQRFAGRSVLVSGAGGGIGRATARAFAAEGADVTCADVDAEAAAATAELLQAEGATARTVGCDVTVVDDVVRAVAAAVDATGRLDVLTNVAGVGAFAPTGEVTLEQWNRTLAVNLTGTFLMCQQALPALVASRGNIVNVASVAGVRAVPYNAAYCASKGGVVMLTKSLAVEFGGEGLRVNCVCPSSVATAFEQRAVDRVREREVVEERCGHGVRAHAVDPHAPAAVLDGQRLGEHDHPALRGAVRGVVGHRPHARDRRDVHDAAA